MPSAVCTVLSSARVRQCALVGGAARVLLSDASEVEFGLDGDGEAALVGDAQFQPKAAPLVEVRRLRDAAHYWQLGAKRHVRHAEPIHEVRNLHRKNNHSCKQSEKEILKSIKGRENIQ